MARVAPGEDGSGDGTADGVSGPGAEGTGPGAVNAGGTAGGSGSTGPGPCPDSR
ncbi:hypothetical protein ACIQV2_25435 [Streptomyces globosus]|uniref:hypothetical protein n=1 Tax=Streptomyces globosus TaxID=68209 RepID=UPI003808A16E